ncbi:hypothetical protein ACJ42O_017080 [Klebsiella pneumoniae]|uniref:hypothetical protein n=1 Tax=Klebsiella pneumoniae TaxID=573 RepID=UPI003890E3A2
MTEILSLLSGGWAYIAAGAAVVIALVASWFTGKKVGSTQTQAKADVAAAQEVTKQAEAVTQQQADIVKVVKNVEQDNQSVSDRAARDRMQQSKYHTDD